MKEPHDGMRMEIIRLIDAYFADDANRQDYVKAYKQVIEDVDAGRKCSDETIAIMSKYLAQGREVAS